jgi:FixJ family two-component response regulator
MRSSRILENQKARHLPVRKSVFVVDDDPSFRMCMKRLLKVHGFNTTLFDSGAALLSDADFGKAFCVILDINLNGQSGIDLRRQLADRGIGLPVIFITGNDSDANRAAAIDAGCVAYLTKPFTAQSLIEPIERVRAAVA